MDKRFFTFNGFTLIELLVVIAVLVVLLTVAFPAFQQSFNRQKINGIGDNIHFLLRFAKAESAKKSRHMWLKIEVDDSNPHSWRIALTDSPSCKFTAANPCLLDGLAREFSNAKYQGVSMETNVTSISIDAIRGRGTAGTTTFLLNDLDVEFRKTQFGNHKLCTNFKATNARYPACD